MEGFSYAAFAHDAPNRASSLFFLSFLFFLDIHVSHAVSWRDNGPSIRVRVARTKHIIGLDLGADDHDGCLRIITSSMRFNFLPLYVHEI